MTTPNDPKAWASLLEEAERKASEARAELTAIRRAMSEHFQHKVEQAFKARGEDWGTVHSPLADGWTLTATTSRSYEWDQGALRGLLDAHWDQLKEAVEISVSVPLAKLRTLPDELRAKVEACGTLKVGAPRLALAKVETPEPAEPEAAAKDEWL